MFRKLSPLVLLVPFASALTVQIPENPTSGGTVTIKWTNEASDTFDTFSFELINTAFNNAFAIANNVNPSASQITITLPIVPVGDGYTLEAVNIGNINDVFASTGSFSIGASTASVTSASTTSGSASSASTTSRSGTSNASGSGSSTAVTSRSTSAAASTNIITTNTLSSSTGASASGSSSSSPTPFNNGAMALNLPVGGLVAFVLSAVAGAAMIAL